jgi:carbon monoxide dehydrogenase subunit G
VKVQESFVVAEPPEKLWEFFDQVDRVAACVPGVDEVETLDADNLRVRLTQAVGPMTATFVLRMRITERIVNERIAFQAVGRAVRGAAGNVRTTNVVTLAAADEGGTRVEVGGDLAMGGVLGSVGQKVIAKQVKQVTSDFAASLQAALKGEPLPRPAGKAGRASAAKPFATPGASDGATAVPTVEAARAEAAPAVAFPLADDRLRHFLAGAVVALLGVLVGALLERRR